MSTKESGSRRPPIKHTNNMWHNPQKYVLHTNETTILLPLNGQQFNLILYNLLRFWFTKIKVSLSFHTNLIIFIFFIITLYIRNITSASQLFVYYNGSYFNDIFFLVSIDTDNYAFFYYYFDEVNDWLLTLFFYHYFIMIIIVYH